MTYLPTSRGPPWHGGGAYGFWGSCTFRFLGIQREETTKSPSLALYFWQCFLETSLVAYFHFSVCSDSKSFTGVMLKHCSKAVCPLPVHATQPAWTMWHLGMVNAVSNADSFSSVETPDCSWCLSTNETKHSNCNRIEQNKAIEVYVFLFHDLLSAAMFHGSV